MLFLLLLTTLNSYVFLYAEGYRLGWLQSLRFVVQLITLTDSHSDAPTNASATQVWIILLLLMGALFVAGFHVVIHHWGQPLLARHPTVKAPKRLRDHVVIIGAGAVGKHVARACEQASQPYVLLDGDQQRLQQATVAGLRGIGGDPHDGQTLQNVRLAQARALVLTERDGLNLALLHQARAHGHGLPRYATQEELPPALLKHAGATVLISAKRRLGERLGALALSCPTLDQESGLASLSVPILPGSSLREHPEVKRLALIRYGHSVPPTGELQLGDLLLLAGRPETLAPLRQLPGAKPYQPGKTDGPILILGAGHVGRAAAAYLKAQGAPVWLLDRQPLPSGWTVERFTQGDATQSGVLRQAGAAEARCCIVALPNDEDATLAVMRVRGLNRGARLLCRASTTEALTALYVAGAEVAVALPEVAGSELAQLVLAPKGPS